MWDIQIPLSKNFDSRRQGALHAPALGYRVKDKNVPTVSIPDHVSQGSVAKLMRLGWIVPVAHIIKREIGRLFMVGDFGKRGQSLAVALVNVARFDESLSYRMCGADGEDMSIYLTLPPTIMVQWMMGCLRY